MLSAELADNSEIFVCDMSLILDKVANLKAKGRRDSMSMTYEIYRFSKKRYKFFFIVKSERGARKWMKAH